MVSSLTFTTTALSGQCQDFISTSPKKAVVTLFPLASRFTSICPLQPQPNFSPPQHARHRWDRHCLFSPSLDALVRYHFTSLLATPIIQTPAGRHPCTRAPPRSSSTLTGKARPPWSAPADREPLPRVLPSIWPQNVRETPGQVPLCLFPGTIRIICAARSDSSLHAL